MEEAQALFSKSQCAADETVDTDDPIIHKNVTNILRKIMTEDLGTWKALAYLEECKSQYPGFDFRVHYNKESIRCLAWCEPTHLIPKLSTTKVKVIGPVWWVHRVRVSGVGV
jgi:hypothetical protein